MLTAAGAGVLLAGLLRLSAQPPAAAVAQGPLATFTATRSLPKPSQTLPAPAKSAAPEQIASGQILVKFSAGAPAGLVRQAVAAYGAPQAAARSLPGLGVTVLPVRPGEELKTAEALRGWPGVEFAEPDYLAQTQDITPNDPNWNLQYGPVKIQAPAAWEITTGSASVTIAVIDTGVDLEHPDLADKIWANPGESGLDGNGVDKRVNGLDDDGDGYVDGWRGWDFVNGDNNPRDDHGHGTHVAGIAAGASNNGLGVAGVAWGAQVMPIKVLSSSGFGSYSDVASGMVWATDHGAQVINLSLGGTAASDLLETAVDYARAHGTLVVAAAGNSPGLPVIYPAAYPNAIAVAATDANNIRSTFSTYGPEVDISAPGTSIWSTFWNGGSTYAYLSGTSMATPHVAGVAALLASLPQFDTPDAIRAALEATALDLGPLGLDWLHGHGLVQAYAALSFDAASAVPTPIPSPTYTQQATQPYAQSCPPAQDFEWVSATGGVNTKLYEDDLFAIVDLPFQFVFDGYTFTQVYVSSNGYLTFGSDATRWVNAPIPDPGAPNLFIAPYWDDLNPKASGNIYYAVLGGEPSRQFVVEWNAVPRYSSSSPGNGQGALTFQAILHEGTNAITFQYLSLQGVDVTGGSATIGLEFAGGADGVEHAYNLPLSAREGLAIQFIPVAGPTPTPPAAALKCPPLVYYFPVFNKNN